MKVMTTKQGSTKDVKPETKKSTPNQRRSARLQSAKERLIAWTIKIGAHVVKEIPDRILRGRPPIDATVLIGNVLLDELPPHRKFTQNRARPSLAVLPRFNIP